MTASQSIRLEDLPSRPTRTRWRGYRTPILEPTRKAMLTVIVCPTTPLIPFVPKNCAGFIGLESWMLLVQFRIIERGLMMDSGATLICPEIIDPGPIRVRSPIVTLSPMIEPRTSQPSPIDVSSKTIALDNTVPLPILTLSERIE